MGKINGTRFPDTLTAENAAEAAEVIVNELGGEPPSKEVLADALGHKSAQSGAYITKVADLRNYGILPNRGLQATTLAQRIANPKDREEYQAAMMEMYRNVPILDDLYEHLRGREPPNQLWSVLADIADIPRNEAKDVEEDIRELYEDMLRFERAEQQFQRDAGAQEGEETSDETDDTEQTNREGTPSVDESSTSGIYLVVDNDEHRFGDLTETNIDIAKQILDAKKGEITSKADRSK